MKTMNRLLVLSLIVGLVAPVFAGRTGDETPAVSNFTPTQMGVSKTSGKTRRVRTAENGSAMVWQGVRWSSVTASAGYGGSASTQVVQSTGGANPFMFAIGYPSAPVVLTRAWAYSGHCGAVRIFDIRGDTVTAALNPIGLPGGQILPNLLWTSSAAPWNEPRTLNIEFSSGLYVWVPAACNFWFQWEYSDQVGNGNPGNDR